MGISAITIFFAGVLLETSISLGVGDLKSMLYFSGIGLFIIGIFLGFLTIKKLKDDK